MPAPSHLKKLTSMVMMLSAMASAPADGPPPIPGAESFVYKTTPQGELSLHVLKPTDPGKAKPGILFFFPGGWTVGKVRTFLPQAESMVKDGWVAILADYRVAKRHHTGPKDAVEDAIDCYAWLRRNAASLDLDPSRLVVAGGSSGGHLAACVGLFELRDGKLEPRSTDRPAALVLFNPVLDVVKYSGDRPGKLAVDDPAAISPLHQLHQNLPPILLMHGTADKTVPVAKAEEFATKAKEMGLAITLITYPDKVHGFFNTEKDEDGHVRSLRDMKAFLARTLPSPTEATGR